MSKKKAFVGAKIFTSHKEKPYANSMVIEDGQVVWIGDDLEKKDLDCEIIDLGGRRVLPGLIDAHMHPVMLAEYSKKISCLPPKINSIEELIMEIQSVAKKQGEGIWIEGWGYDEGKLAEKRSPNRYDLDRGAKDTPVVISRTCGHIRCVNSKALELAGIDKNTKDPQGGQIDRDENGEPTGVLRENARNLMLHLLPVQSREEVVNNIVDMGEILASQGITAACDIGNLEEVDNYQDYIEAVAKGFKQKIGIYYIWDYFYNNDKLELTAEKMDREKQIFQSGLKLIGDGSVSGRTAWMDKPYLGTEDEYGLPVYEDTLVDTAIAMCKEKHCQLSVHAMGGRAIDRILDRVVQEEKWTETELPHLRIEHVTEPSIEAMKTCREKGIAMATQPIFLYAEIESYINNLGLGRMQEAYPVMDMLDQGVQFCFSTDAPATSWASPSNPFPCIKGAVTRRAYDGTDCGNRHRVDIETAICLYTREAAKIAGFDRLGQLREGYQGDFIVLRDDILEIDSEKIDKMEVEETYIAGNRVYVRERRDS